MAGKNVLILGGEVGGLVAANELRKRLSKEHKITIIDKSAKHLFTPSLLWLIFGWRKADKIQKDLSRLQKKGIEYLQAEIHKIDAANKLVLTSVKKLSYDYLLIALGAEINPEGVLGFSQAAHQFYDLQGALKLKEALKDFDGGRAIMLISRGCYMRGISNIILSRSSHRLTRKKGN